MSEKDQAPDRAGLVLLALINAVSHVIADEQRGDGGLTAVFSEMGGVREDA